MCGIVAYKGNKDCHPILLDGLKRLEYRGYDSAGTACNHNGKLVVTKCRGKVADLERILKSRKIYSDCSGSGMAHTRWATHGEPNRKN